MRRHSHTVSIKAKILLAAFAIGAVTGSGSFAFAADSVSLVTLIANPEAKQGRQVLVSGYLTLDFEGRALYLHEDDYRHSQYKNGLWVNIDREKYQQYDGQYVVVEGEFNAADTGHMGLWSGALTNIERILVAPKPTVK